MKIDLDISLDSTLGCGQAHRWIKKDNYWEGVIGNEIVNVRDTTNGIETNCNNRQKILNYMRADDDLESITSEISSRDPYIMSLTKNCYGLRILRQDHWECIATYILATNANLTRIKSMVESVCNNLGKDLGGRHKFPTAHEILDNRERIKYCKLGFREKYFIELAESVESGYINPESIMDLDYEDCTKALMDIKGIGPKVADCISMFSYEHLEAFPVDARISKIMKEVYGITGKYKEVSKYGRDKFGKYAGYAQELLYYSKFINCK